jgi:hypothetical protein
VGNKYFSQKDSNYRGEKSNKRNKNINKYWFTKDFEAPTMQGWIDNDQNCECVRHHIKGGNPQCFCPCHKFIPLNNSKIIPNTDISTTYAKFKKKSERIR